MTICCNAYDCNVSVVFGYQLSELGPRPPIYCSEWQHKRHYPTVTHLLICKALRKQTLIQHDHDTRCP